MDSWKKRDSATHVQKAIAAREAKTASAQVAMEQSCGIRYSVLLELILCATM